MKPETLEVIKIYGDIFFCNDSFARSVIATLDSIDINAHIKEVKLDFLDDEELDPPSKQANKGYVNSKGVAEISLSGPVTKKPTSMSSLFGGFSTIQAEKSINSALKDGDIKSILIKIDSPGGSVNGVQALADRIYNADLIKPVCVYAEDCMCSAGYWPGSQGRFLAANETALLANIGGYLPVNDVSKLYEKLGVKTTLIKKGENKGIGYPGTPLTDEQKAELQRVVDSQVALFTSSVARGRNIPLATAEKLTDGRIYVGAEAISNGLIDRVMSYDMLLGAMQQGIYDPAKLKKVGANMSEENNKTESMLSQIAARLGIGTRAEEPNNVLLASELKRDPILVKADELGIKTVEDLTKLHTNASLSEELQTEYRAETAKNVIRAYGVEKSESIVKLVNSTDTPFSVVKATNEACIQLTQQQFEPKDRETVPAGKNGAADVVRGSAEANEEEYNKTLSYTSTGQTILEKSAKENGKKVNVFG